MSKSRMSRSLSDQQRHLLVILVNAQARRKRKIMPLGVITGASRPKEQPGAAVLRQQLNGSDLSH